MSIPIDDINGNSSLDVIAATGDGINNAYSIVAFDGNTLNPIWNFPIGSTNGGGRELIRYPVNGETNDIIAGAYFGMIYRIDGETGTAVWTFPIGSFQAIHEFSLLNDINGDGLKEVLAATASNSFLCLDGATGSVLWSVPLGNYSWSTSAIPDINGDNMEDVVAASRNDSLYVFDGTDGSKLHAHPMNSGMLQGATLASTLPDMDNDSFYEILGADDSGKIIALSGAVTCTPGFLGDVNGDDLVNSTDALILLSFDAGLPIAPGILQRINIGFGDVTEDDVTNSTDALAILSYDAQIPVPFPVGDPVCLPDNAKRTFGKSKSTVEYDGSIQVTADYHSKTQIAPGETIVIPVMVDMSDIPEKLGSYTA
ncbi:MAG: PQQ-binding-like beta-propeller repeat protein, partial [Gammaproteobacteria bacterium]|nr:PQQ-binding-like beta-propeller repeat protein [Gammaproteobacteria bacterium]NIX59752.1 PQQ-binding-like beta-propeller repeat protein [candidate division Zixibacteria bacterium]